MVKVTKVTQRGTATRRVDVGKMNWSGDDYREEQQNRFERIPKNFTLHLGRGVRTIKAKDLPRPTPRPSTEGMTRITNRGTSSRTSQNKGSQ